MEESPCPRFRQDLVVRRVVEAGDVGYTIRDPLTGDYYRQHPMTRELCLLLDGQRTPPQVLVEMGRRYPQYRFSRDFLEEALESLRRMNFLEDTFKRNLMLIERGRVERRGLLEPESLKNVLNIQLGIIDPLPTFRRIHPYVRFLFHRAYVVFAIAVFALCLGLIYDSRELFAHNAAAMFTLQNATPLHLLILYATLFATIMAHEFGHGLCCYHYGGEPRRLGLLLMYFMPGMFCDVSDTYFFEKRWPRAATALAGTYVEMQVFSLATFVWLLTNSDLLIHDIAYRVMLFAGISGFIFNMNPLIKLDGYYVLMSWLDIPRLRERSFEWVGARFRSLFTRDTSKVPRATRRERRVFLIYGLASMTYSVLILTVVLRFLRHVFVGNFHETGVVIFLIIMLSMTKRYWIKAWKGMKLLALERAGFARRRVALTLGGVAAAIVLFVMPLPYLPRHEASLDAFEALPVRAPVAGTISEVFVGEGDPVREGTVLARITATEREAERQAEEARLASATIEEREQALRERSRLSGPSDIEAARNGRMQSHSSEAWLSAPGEGRVLSPRTGTLYGRTVAPGDSVLFVGRMDSLRVVIPLTEREAEDAAVGRRAELRLLVDPGHAYRFRLDSVDLAPEDARFDRANATELAHSDASHRVYRAYGSIANPLGRLRPGFSGTVRIEAPPRSLFDRLAHLYAQMVRADFWL
ncbi:MAG TPA: biotin/lipoyl-binding protein [Candidatus Eisenbacteria bacterium]|nr:biotin/lipoyl-binding protein [Candidatus Eisenbacteria bacterium]